MAERTPVRNIVPKPGEELTDARLTEILQGVLKNFDVLYGMFPLQGNDLANVLKLAVAGNRKVGFGEGTLTWTASASAAAKEIEHGIGSTPSVVLVTSTNPALIFAANTFGSTKFKAEGFSVAGAISGTFTFYWLAIG